MKDDGGPAFPRPLSTNPGNGEISWDANGMSLRDWFAGMALQGLIAGYRGDGFGVTTAASHAYETADAMLKARRI